MIIDVQQDQIYEQDIVIILKPVLQNSPGYWPETMNIERLPLGDGGFRVRNHLGQP